jgi:hypothetical protein
MLPDTPEAAEAIATITHWMRNLFAELLHPEAGHYVMFRNTATRLRRGEVDMSRVIEAATRERHAYAVNALQRRVAEMTAQEERLPAELAAYLEEAARRPPVRSKRGRDEVDHVLRDKVLAICVEVACERWGLLPTRNQKASNRPEEQRQLSGSSLVAEAFNRSGFGIIGERQVERIARQYKARKNAARLSASA